MIYEWITNEAIMACLRWYISICQEELRNIMKSFSQDNGKIKDQYYNCPLLIFHIKFKPRGQIMNYETF